MKRLFSAFCVLFTVTGCSSVPHNATTEVREFSEPGIGTVYEAYVGDRMLHQGKASTADYLQVQKAVDGVHYNIFAGFYKALGSKNGKNFYSASSSDSKHVVPGLLSDPAVALSVNKNNEVCITTPFITEVTCYEGAAPREIKRTIESTQNFQQTLVYSGNSGTKINVSYREFSGGMARQAFTNNVEYDMDKSKIIRYKGAELEVLEYSNVSIKFRVLKHFKPMVKYTQ